MSAARSAFQTVLSRWDINTGPDSAFIIPNHDRANNQTTLTAWFKNTVTSQSIDRSFGSYSGAPVLGGGGGVAGSGTAAGRGQVASV
jgi:hypothetical protein